MTVKTGRNLFVPLFIISGVILSLVVLIVIKGDSSPSVFASWLVAISLIIIVINLIENLSDGRARPLNLLYCIYMLLFYLLPGFLHLTTGQFPFFSAGYSADQLDRASIVILIFIVTSLFSYFTAPQVRDLNIASTNSTRLLVSLLICVSIGLASGAAYGLTNLLTTRGVQGESTISSTPIELILASLARSCTFYAFIYSIVLLSFHKIIGRFVICALSFCLFVLFNSPLAIPRFVLGGYAIAGFFTFFKITPLRKVVLFFAFAALQTTLFSYISFLSRGEVGTTFDLSPFEYLQKSGDFDGFQSTVNVIKLVEDRGYSLGRSGLSAVLFFLPREVWPDKSIGLGGEAAINVGYPFFNISSPLPSEFYVDFGVGGEVIFAFLFGRLLSYSDEAFEIFATHKEKMGMIVVASFAGYVFILLRGSLVGTLGPVALSVSITWLVKKYAQLK